MITLNFCGLLRKAELYSLYVKVPLSLTYTVLSRSLALTEILYLLITTQQNTANKILIKEKHSDMEEF